MKAFVYSDHAENFSNPKLSHFPAVKVLAVLLADDILEADRQFDSLVYPEIKGDP